MSSASTEHMQHYAPGNIDVAVEAALAARGKERAPLTTTDLEGMDQFHSGGLAATRMLAERATITESDRVLDIGGGLGGSARVLAQEIGCDVTVIDLTEAYCRVGEKLTERANLSDRVHFHVGNALNLPFEDERFDVVWTQHSSMNIADKTQFYEEIHRVLRTGGRLAQHEVIAGSGEPLYFPVPWAQSETMSFLQSQDECRSTLTRTGFHEVEWKDISQWTLAWFQERLLGKPTAPETNGLGLHLLVGQHSGIMVHNFIRNMRESHIRVVQAIFERMKTMKVGNSSIHQTGVNDHE